MVMYAEGWRRRVCLLLFVAMCCPQGRQPSAFVRNWSQVGKTPDDSTSVRNEDSASRARELFRQGAALIEKDRFAAAGSLLRPAAELCPEAGLNHHDLRHSPREAQSTESSA